MRARRTARLGLVVGVASVAVLGTAPPASAEPAEVLRPECGWAPDPESGETESIPGTGITQPITADTCVVVLTPSGQVRYVIQGQAPAGYSAERTLVLRGASSTLVVTPSGRITERGTLG
ncbi:hypothetical protein [Geodermatophilus sp. SYSU D00766]